MRYILNSAVITSQGLYSYRIISVGEAREWISNGPWMSTIGYPETAAFASQLLGVEVPVNRVSIRMNPGDEALVIRIVLPPGSPRLDPSDKGRLGEIILAGHFELGLLRCLPSVQICANCGKPQEAHIGGKFCPGKASQWEPSTAVIVQP